MDKVKIKQIKSSIDRSKKQKDTLAKHKKNHTAKHMTMMRKLMNDGKSFTAAHKVAMQKVGA